MKNLLGTLTLLLLLITTLYTYAQDVDTQLF